ncbi:tetratricopeptide repeat protein [Streptomyces sp. NPDC001817]|uniref:tetratricopeptide repeat protein n=1 Tax=Streptomyces sp. NPDC001817 TaxID=3154398 RepID=UPI00332AED83
MYPALIDDLTRVLGPDDCDTLIARANHARCVGRAGDTAGAVQLYPALIEDLTRVLGADARDTLFARTDHAYYVGEAGDVAEAVRLYPALITDLTRVLSPDARHTLIARTNHALYLGRAGDTAEAVRLYPALVEDLIRVLGPDTRETLFARANHAYYVGEAGDAAGAVQLYPALVEDLTRVLGPDDRETLFARNKHAHYVEEANRAAARAARVQGLKELLLQHAAAGEVDALAAQLLALISGPPQSKNWGKARTQLRRLTPEDRTALADGCATLYHSGEKDWWDRRTVLFLVGVIACDLPGDWLLAERQEMLARFSREYTLVWGRSEWVLADAEVAAGRPLAPELVAVLRRWAVLEPSTVLARKLTEPALNVGEAWAEQALRDTRDSPDWHALLLHLTTATSAKPTPQWEERARLLISPLGADRVRESVVSWLALAGRRTFELAPQRYGPDVNSTYEPYNAHALRGLVWVLGLLPAHPDTVRALRALVETSLRKVAGAGPRSPKVANAAVTVLSRIDGEPALAELARLATRVTFKGTLKLIDAALQTRAQALGLSR